MELQLQKKLGHPQSLLIFSASWSYESTDTHFQEYRNLVCQYIERMNMPITMVSIRPELEKTAKKTDEITQAIEVGYEENEMIVEMLRKFEVNELPSVMLIESKSWRQVKVEETSYPKEFKQLYNEWVKKTVQDVPQREENDAQIRTQALELYEEGQFSKAASLLSAIAMRNPKDTIANFNFGVILHTMGLSRLAISPIVKVLKKSPNDATAHSILKSVLFPVEAEAVIRGYEEIVAENPDNFRAVHALAALSGKAESSDARYVAHVFDELAHTFEDKLVNHLEYRVPWQLLEGVQEVTSRDRASWYILDLGCGTGLCGKLFHPFSQHMIGVDLSPSMIEKARSTGVYDDLRAEKLEVTASSCATESIDLVLAADVWIYVGKLENIFQECQRILKPGGLLGFSIEEVVEKGINDYVLDPTGRFRHTVAYIKRLASEFSFTVKFQRSVVVRKESNDPIQGYVFVLQRL